MSTFRHRYRIVVDDEPHDIVTSARDFAAVQMDSGANGADMTYLLIHTACMRLDVPGIPSDLDKFVDLLDELEDLDGIPVGVPAEAIADPIPSAESGG
jgi:hypothetical protein